ncbi:hypothetical protein PO909_023926 [Leuciscus waleckii]
MPVILNSWFVTHSVLQALYLYSAIFWTSHLHSAAVRTQDRCHLPWPWRQVGLTQRSETDQSLVGSNWVLAWVNALTTINENVEL